MPAFIIANFDETKVGSTGELETILKVECQKNRKPLSNEEVELFVGGSPIEKKKADAQGKVEFTIKCPAGTKILKGQLKSSPNGGDRNWTLNITTPTASAATAATGAAAAGAAGTTVLGASPAASQPKADKNDPVEIQVLRSALPEAGKFRLFARVLNYKGKGLKNAKVGFIFQGELVETETNAAGLCRFPKETAESISIKLGSEEKVTAFVSGIADLTTTHLIRRRKLTGKAKADALKNNQRARCFFGIAGISFAVWLIAAIVISFGWGWGEPLFRSTPHQLTSQQTFFNSIPGVAEAGYTAKVPEIRGQWQKPTIFLSLVAILLWTIFSIFYGIISLREELAEAWHAWMEKMIDRHYVKSQDPLFERMAAWSGHLARATVQPAAASATPSQPTLPTEKAGKKGFSFWDLVRSSMVSDFIFELLPRILHILKGGKK